MAGPVTITVPPGGSLWSIARLYLGAGSRWPLIYQENPQLGPNPDQVIAGQVIFLPAAPPPPDVASDTALITAAVTTLTTAVTVAAAASALAGIFAARGIPRLALLGALGVVMSFPSERLGAPGPATRAVISLNTTRKAQFLVASARRIATSLREAVSRRENVASTLADAITRERRYFAAHITATWNRADAAAKVDSAASVHGPLLGWRAVHDKITSAECRRADGKNFLATRMPLIGWPGAVHPSCRCWASAPREGAPMLP